MTKTTISETFMESLKNAYGSKHNFERELIYKAYQFGNKGKMFFSLSPYLNFSMYPEETKDDYNNFYPLLECNLDACDIYNFIEDIDYSKLSNAYIRVRQLMES